MFATKMSDFWNLYRHKKENVNQHSNLKTEIIKMHFYLEREGKKENADKIVTLLHFWIHLKI